MAQLALVSDDLHFLQHLLPTWKQQFDLRVLNPPKPPPRIRGPRDLLAEVLDRRLCRRRQTPRAPKAGGVFFVWVTHIH